MWNHLDDGIMDKKKENMPEMVEKCSPFVPYIKVSKLARVYVPDQQICKLYNGLDGIKAGTIFPELNEPYCGYQKMNYGGVENE